MGKHLIRKYEIQILDPKSPFCSVTSGWEVHFLICNIFLFRLLNLLRNLIFLSRVPYFPSRHSHLKKQFQNDDFYFASFEYIEKLLTFVQNVIFPLSLLLIHNSKSCCTWLKRNACMHIKFGVVVKPVWDIQIVKKVEATFVIVPAVEFSV